MKMSTLLLLILAVLPIKAADLSISELIIIPNGSTVEILFKSPVLDDPSQPPQANCTVTVGSESARTYDFKPEGDTMSIRADTGSRIAPGTTVTVACAEIIYFLK